MTESLQTGELISGYSCGSKVGMLMSDQIVLLVEQVKMLAGEIAFSTSTLKCLMDQSINDPQGSRTQNLECEIREKTRQMSLLEQRITESSESSIANASLADMQQIFQPWIQKRRFEYLTQKFVKDKLQVLLTTKGQPNTELIREIFQGIDHNGDNYISPAELGVLIIGIKLEDDFFIRSDYVDKVREAFDVDGDTNINEDEFVAGLSKCLLDAQQSANRNVLKVSNTSTEKGQSLLVLGTSSPSVED